MAFLILFSYDSLLFHYVSAKALQYRCIYFAVVVQSICSDSASPLPFYHILIAIELRSNADTCTLEYIDYLPLFFGWN